MELAEKPKIVAGGENIINYRGKMSYQWFWMDKTITL